VGLATAEDVKLFKRALIDVAQVLAQAIARDGEGATKLVEVNLTGASDVESARKAARGVTISPLIKSAIHGEDPNWGRILARLGAEKIPASALQKLTLSIQGLPILEGGMPVPFDRTAVRLKLKEDTIRIGIHLNSGEAEATAWGCDLSKKYVEINTEYS
jgi:glutamate N-acetyltransferase/amino-acid N-acetyltransferase